MTLRSIPFPGGRRVPVSDAPSSGRPAGSVATATAPSDRERPIGVALIASPDLYGGRAYLCDPDAHCIHVLDQDYRPVFSFGGYGSSLGQFDTPTDVAIIWIDVSAPAECTADTAVLVVADSGNHRLQLFDLDGVAIGVLGGGTVGIAAWSSAGWPIRAGWPFFRLADLPVLAFPSRLEWRAPYLDVACSGATMVRLDLAAALLPDFRAWVQEAPPSALRQAFRRFASDPTRADVPAACLLQIVERLQPVPLGGVVLPWRGRA
jgi:hypothetical protein